MSLQRTTAPSIDPITLAEAKLHLRVDHSDEDALITALIAAAREACEHRTGRTLITSGWTLTLGGFATEIPLLMPPLVSVTSVTYKDTAGATQTLSSGLYEVDRARGVPLIVAAPGASYPDTYAGRNAVTVVYTAGYGATANDVPVGLKQWMLLAVTDMYENRSISSDKPVIRQNFADSLLDPFVVYA